MSIRQLVFEVAGGNPEIGALEETLKWGEPAYLTTQTKVGSTLRMDWKAKAPDHVSLFFNCQTDIVERLGVLFGQHLEFVGKRELKLPIAQPLPLKELAICIETALTYHLNRHRMA